MGIDECLKAIADGNVDALEVLYAEMRVAVFSVVLSVVRDQQLAEDLTQETFLRIYTYAGRYEPGTNSKAWILTVAR